MLLGQPCYLEELQSVPLELRGTSSGLCNVKTAQPSLSEMVYPFCVRIRAAAVLLSLALAKIVRALNNGYDQTPPQGWRSWNAFGSNITQSIMEETFFALVSRNRSVDGVPTSLLDLGYISAGLDDGWMACQPEGGYHNASGWPLVNTTRFPDLAAMNAKARVLGLRPGFYLNGCWCKDRCSSDACFEGDVAASVSFGFQSVKIDACSGLKNMTKFETLFNATGVRIELEDCWNSEPLFPGANGFCPMNFFRVSADIFASYGSIVSNIVVAAGHADKGQSFPGCWIHPDMLTIGVFTVPEKGGSGWPFLTDAEARTHMGMWCTMSSPLILGLDLRDDSAMDKVWPIIANKEAIAINQAWTGDSGRLVSSSAETATLLNCSFPMNGVANNCSKPAEMIFRKHLTENTAALLLVNNRAERGNVTTNWTEVGVQCPCTARDLWAHEDLGPVGNATGWTVALDSHDSAFVIVTTI